MNKRLFKSTAGVTLIELLIALVVSAILVAGIYRVFIHQQRTYRTQEDVADMQQNVRVAINRMIREIRMAGFGGKNENTNGNNDIINVFGNVNTFTSIINPANDVTVDGIIHDQITLLAAYDQIATLEEDVVAGSNSFKVNFTGNTRFDQPWRKYVCINGRNSYAIIPAGGDTLTLEGGGTLNENHSAGEPVFLVRAIRYGLRMDNGTSVLFRDLYPATGGSQRVTVAENIEALQFRYVLADSSEVDTPGDPRQVRGVRVTLTARTQMSDPELKTGGGFRRRTLVTYIDLRNLRDETP
ncbi:MAG: prepilin-type N-terminal cleavage/methylation domain-containing protein [Deltaproteobacteria bacterium]|nr:prepilin-type N-terminal cleavage/methylation domain-containing protein [Deltaproteobacteria bacterium]